MITFSKENDVNCYWWIGDNRRNFGDELAPMILRHFSQVRVDWAEPQSADIVSTGSGLAMLPESGWNGIVAGSGKLLAEKSTDLTNATVLGLRGRLTLQDVKLTQHDRANVVLGDPGLLVSDMVPVERDKYPLGCVPHITDAELFPRELARSRRQHYVEPILI